MTTNVINLKVNKMGTLQKDDAVFQVADEVEMKYPELVKLVLNTESMDANEKQYWFDILPSMTDEQVDRLFDILETERRKLEELEVRYQEEIRVLNEKHLLEWQELQAQRSRSNIKQAEEKDSEKGNVDDVLKMLDEL